METATEQAFVHQFVKPELRERWSTLLAGKRRRKILERLFHDFDFAAPRINKVTLRELGARGELEKQLRGFGLGEPFYIISVSESADGMWQTFSQLEDPIHDGTVLYDPRQRLAVLRRDGDCFVMAGHDG